MPRLPRGLWFYAFLMTVFGILLFTGALLILVVQSTVDSFLFWNNLLFGVSFVSSGIVVFRRLAPGMVLATVTGGLYFSSKVVAVTLTSGWHWHSVFLTDIIGIMLSILAFYAYRRSVLSVTFPQADQPPEGS